MPPRRVLVVEDDADIRFNLREILEYERYAVLEADNGQTALDLLRGLAPDALPSCILLDLMMPVLDGFAFHEIVQREFPDTLAKIPVVVATAMGDRNARMPAKAERIRKPIDLDELCRILERLCGEAR